MTIKNAHSNSIFGSPRRRFLVYIAIGFALSMTSCGESPWGFEPGQETGADEASLRVTERLFEAIETQDLDTASSLLHPDTVWESRAAMSGTTRDEHLPRYDGLDEVLAELEYLFRHFQRSIFREESYFSASGGETVFAELRGDFSHSNSTDSYQNLYLFKVSVNNGLVSRIDQYYNPIHAANVLGWDPCADLLPLKALTEPDPVSRISPPSSPAEGIVARLFAEVARQDLSAVSDLLHSDSVWEVRASDSGSTDPTALQRFEGREAILTVIQLLFDTFVTSRMSFQEFFETTSPGTVFAELKGDFRVRGTETRYQNLYLYKVSVRGERISEIVEYYNPIHFARILGPGLCGE